MTELSAYFAQTGLKKSSYPDKESLFHQIRHYPGKGQSFSELVAGHKTLIIGAPQDSHSTDQSAKQAPKLIRQQLYALYPPQKLKPIADLGDLRLPPEAKQANTALRDVCHYLLRGGKNIILIGGGQYLTYGPFQAFGLLGHDCHMLSLNARSGLSAKGAGPDPASYLDQILFNKDAHLASHTTLGLQQYYASPGQVKLMKANNWDYHRLGHFRQQIEDTEPILREKDLISANLNSARHADAPGHQQPSANGFTAEEFCQISRYAGTGTRCKLFGLFGLSPVRDINAQSATLAAQAIWHYMDGLSIRRHEHPGTAPPDFKLYHIHTDMPGIQLRFHQSKKSGRWWMEQSETASGKSTFRPSNEKAYHAACKGELPDMFKGP